MPYSEIHWDSTSITCQYERVCTQYADTAAREEANEYTLLQPEEAFFGSRNVSETLSLAPAVPHIQDKGVSYLSF